MSLNYTDYCFIEALIKCNENFYKKKHTFALMVNRSVAVLTNSI